MIMKNELLSMLDIKNIISPKEIQEAVEMRANGELSSTGMKEVIFSLYKERLNLIMNALKNSK